jgi:hypothetical protein
MRIGKLARTLISVLENPITRKHAVLVLGPAGIGKSDVMRQTAAYFSWPIIDIRLSQMDPVDLRGIPYVEEQPGMPGTRESTDMLSATSGTSGTQRRTAWCPPSWLPDAERDGPEGIMFLDEINGATPAVAAAAYQLILDRALGDYKVPPGWAIAAAGNNQSDRGVTYTMPAPLTNRFSVWQAEPHIDDFTHYAAHAGCNDKVMAFLRFRSDYLHKFSGKDYVSGQQFPTPRGWMRVSDHMNLDLPDSDMHELIRGDVGEEAGQEFITFCLNYEGLVSVEEILADPARAPVPPDIGKRYAVTMALAARMDKNTTDKMWTYLKRMPRDFQVLAVTLAYRRNKTEIMRTAMFAEFAEEIIAILQPKR